MRKASTFFVAVPKSAVKGYAVKSGKANGNQSPINKRESIKEKSKMAVLIQDKVTGNICGEYIITSVEELRRIEEDYNVIRTSEKED